MQHNLQVSLNLTCGFCISTGFAGGSYYSASGGGANYLCLRSDPIFRPTDEVRSSRAEVYGAEYRFPPKSMLQDHEVPCVICQVTRRSVLMMPGTNLCDQGWTTKYVGHISSTKSVNNGHYRTEFVCTDDDAEMTAYSSPDEDLGVLFYPTQVICGSVPCIPYVADKDLLCVVCTR